MKFDLQFIIDAIRAQRKRLDYSQEYLAFRLKISQNSYSKLELNNTVLTVHRLVEVCDVLDLDVPDLLRESLNRQQKKMPPVNKV